VYYIESRKTTKPFLAQIQVGSKGYHICGCATAEAAARAYDAIARMIPNQKLNFPTTGSAAAFGAVPSNGAGAIPSESELIAAIAAIRQPQQPRREIKYVGVYRSEARARPFKAQIWVDGKNKYLGCHPTAEAAARAHDVVARTISGRKVSFPVVRASTPNARVQAAACAHAGSTTQPHPAQPIGQHVQPYPPHDRHLCSLAQTTVGGEDNGYSAAAEDPARSSKRTRIDSLDMQHQSRQPLPPLQQHYHQRPSASSAPTAQPLSSLQLFLDAAYDGEPLDGSVPFIVVD
jgi:hypothetical protein